MRKTLKSLNHFIGIGSNRTSHREKLISGAGGFLGIFFSLIITRQFVGADDAALIVASMGASAVLLFAVPHGPLSQPWALTAGHLISAAIGVACYQLIPDTFIAAAGAVALSITTMYYLRCIHPPGGATALTAVIASSGVHDLGFWYLLTPVLLNVAVMLSVAIAFNYLFSWRRYPAAMMQYRDEAKTQQKTAAEGLSRQDLEYALDQMNRYVDVSHADLEHIFHLAKNREQGQLPEQRIKLGRYYSNGEYGSHWSIRQVVDESGRPGPESDQIIYKVVAGRGRRSSGTLSREEFSRWARHEVYLNENSWLRVTTDSGSAVAQTSATGSGA